MTRTRTGTRAVSIGLTESIETEGRHLLMNQADIALYEAKRTRLSAVAYHPGLSPGIDSKRDDLPSHEQRALAAALARAVDAKDVGTRSHSETVAQLCVAIGERLQIDPAGLERVRLAGLLHDVGKIGVADAILQKPGSLAPEELSAMTEHVEIGHAILLAAELPIEAHWVLHHHERIDGRGYPTGLSGASIPVESRIIAVADAFEAMTGTRPVPRSGVGRRGDRRAPGERRHAVRLALRRRTRRRRERWPRTRKTSWASHTAATSRPRSSHDARRLSPPRGASPS